MNGTFGITYEQLQPKLFLSAGPSATKHGPNKAQVEKLRTELCHRNRAWVEDGQRMNELRADVRHLQDKLAERDLAVVWAVNSRSVAWDREAKAHARVTELSVALDNLQVYCNTLHEEVHVLYSQLHPSAPAHPVELEARPSHVAGHALGGELDLFQPPPSMRLVDEWSPTPDDEAAKSNGKQE